MKRSHLLLRACILILAICTYATWYELHRHAIIERLTKCANVLEHPESSPTSRAPDGTAVQIFTPCLIEATPPSLWELLTGHTTPSKLPPQMTLYPYTLADVLLGNYSVGPTMLGCDQAATSANCALIEGAQSAPTAATGGEPVMTQQHIGNFSFELDSRYFIGPFGWEGVVSPGNYQIPGLGQDGQSAIYIFTAGGIMSSIDPAARTLEDYRGDYPLATSTPAEVVHIKKSESLSINSIPMLKQRYSIGHWQSDVSGGRVFVNDSDGEVMDWLRYVFFDGSKFVVMTDWQADDTLDALVKTIHLDATVHNP